MHGTRQGRYRAEPADPRRPLLHLLAGVSVASLARILARRRGFSRRAYGQLAVMAASALLRWPGCTVEAVRVARRVRKVVLDPPPVFIVGHWRSGTTLLHNLMGRDGAFCYPTMVDALRPYDFYPNPLDFITRRILLRYLPPTRPMDEVRLDPDLPQEEEFALATMGAPSFLNCLYFPRHITEVFAQEVLFTGSAAEESVRHWREALRYYLAKLAANNPGRRLLLKNPANSARIRHLRALFPGAKFIHVHRHPAAVFSSTRGLYRTLIALFALQDHRDAEIDEHVLWAYPQVMNRLLDALAELPERDVTSVSYAELTADPASTLRRVYRDLDLGDFDRIEPSLKAYVARNPCRRAPARNIDRQTASRLASQWGTVCARLGYSSLSPGDNQ